MDGVTTQGNFHDGQSAVPPPGTAAGAAGTGKIMPRTYMNGEFSRDRRNMPNLGEMNPYG
jgi:hypothetical protein